MNQYDITFQEMRKQIDKFKDLMLNKNNSTLNPEGINNLNIEMNSIVESIKDLEDAKLNPDEDLFGFKSELITGNNTRKTRSFDSDMIKINSNKISMLLLAVQKL